MLGLLILFEVEYCLAANRSGDVFVSLSSCSVGLLDRVCFPVLAPGSLRGVVSADLTDVLFSSPDGLVV